MLFVEHVRWISGGKEVQRYCGSLMNRAESMSRAVNLWVEGRTVSHYSLDVAEEEEGGGAVEEASRPAE